MNRLFGAAKLTILAAAIATGVALIATGQNASTTYHQTNLVSDGFVPATFTDPHLVNPWGLSRSAGSYWWASDNGAGVSTLYDGSGNIQTLVVTVPSAGGVAPG